MTNSTCIMIPVTESIDDIVSGECHALDALDSLCSRRSPHPLIDECGLGADTLSKCVSGVRVPMRDVDVNWQHKSVSYFQSMA